MEFFKIHLIAIFEYILNIHKMIRYLTNLFFYIHKILIYKKLLKTYKKLAYDSLEPRFHEILYMQIIYI